MILKDIEKQLQSTDTDEKRAAVLMLKEPLPQVDEQGVITLLLKAMQDISWRVRKTAQEILFENFSIDSYMNSLIGLLYIDDNAGARNSAIETLTRLNKKATPFLISAFNTPNNDVRKFIIDVLGQFHDKRALKLMLEALKDEDENVRASAVEHLGVIGEPSVVDALIEILEIGDLWTAYPAADALGRIGDRKAVPALIKALLRKPLREPALRALGNMGDPESINYVVPFLEDKSKSVQETAMMVIEEFYHKGVNEELITGQLRSFFGDRVIHVLLEHAWSSKHEVRASAILILGLLKDENVLDPLLDLSVEEDFAGDVKRALVFIGKDKPEIIIPLFEKESPQIRRFICSVASEIASPLYYDIFREFIDDEDGHVRTIAAVGLANIRDKRAIGPIKNLLVDPYIDVQEAAIKALKELMAGMDTKDLRDSLLGKNPILRKNIALLLGSLTSKEAVPALGFALKDEDVSVRRAVVTALSLIKTNEAIKYLTLALTDEDPDIRVSAALSLGLIGGAAAVEPLCLLLNDPDDRVRVAATKALGILADKAAGQALIKILYDKNGFVVTTAISSLGRLGGRDARNAIVKTLSSDDREIKRTAIKALSNFEDIEDDILPFIRDNDWATRIAAIETLSIHLSSRARMELEKLFDEEEDPAVRKILERILNV